MYISAENKDILSVSSKASVEMCSNIEICCETRRLETEVKWFIGAEEVSDGGRYSMKQYGFSRRLVIKDVQPTDSGNVAAVAGSENVSVQFAVAGELYWVFIGASNNFIFCINTNETQLFMRVFLYNIHVLHDLMIKIPICIQALLKH